MVAKEIYDDSELDWVILTKETVCVPEPVPVMSTISPGTPLDIVAETVKLVVELTVFT